MKRFWKILTFLGMIVFLILAGSLLTRIYYHKSSEKENPAPEKESFRESVQINILNATQVPGIASQARAFLREKEIDVVEIGNFESPVAASYIIDRVGDFKSAQKLAKAAGIKDSLIVEEIDSALFLKCTLILGEDFKRLTPFIK